MSFWWLFLISCNILDDVQIVFYQEEDGCVVWEANGEFSSSDVHKQVAISFRTPAYKVTDVRKRNS